MKRTYGPGLPGMALIGGALAALYWLERRRPLREEAEPGPRRTLRNLAVAGLAAGTVQALEAPVVGPLADLAARRRWGLLRRLPIPRRLEAPLALLLMDYTFYLRHVLNHRVRFLWRFHRVHHVDLDLDATTALRFHFGKMALSVPFRAEVVLIGVTPRVLATWQALGMIEILFHHSNVGLPPRVERWLSRLIVTPRMHGIHHSVVEDETNSNWSSGLTLWDWLHGTLRLDVPQDEITIGVPAYRDPAELTLPKLVVMPFGPQRPTWTFPDGEPSRRIPRPATGELEPRARP